MSINDKPIGASVMAAMNLLAYKEKMLSVPSSELFEEYLHTLCKNKKRPLGVFSPWAWWFEIVRGCNLRCYHCATRLFPKEQAPIFMSLETWKKILTIINLVNPYTRIEFGNAGEPTLHPQLLDFLHVGRELCPTAQFLIYTNGTTLIDGRITYKQLFDAGLNMAYVNMYAPRDTHMMLAEASGYYWYFQDVKPADAVNVFQQQYQPGIHVILLANHPANWTKQKKGRGYLQTFFNDLDWPEASKYGMTPVTESLHRRCDLPLKFVNITYDGRFTQCCFDFMRHTVHEFGDINATGFDAFINYWFGEYMQTLRMRLFHKDRAANPYCAKCCFTSIRGDIPYWPESRRAMYWQGDAWHPVK